jgi:hypothetical protein
MSLAQLVEHVARKAKMRAQARIRDIIRAEERARGVGVGVSRRGA